MATSDYKVRWGTIKNLTNVSEWATKIGVSHEDDDIVSLDEIVETVSVTDSTYNQGYDFEITAGGNFSSPPPNWRKTVDLSGLFKYTPAADFMKYAILKGYLPPNNIPSSSYVDTPGTYNIEFDGEHIIQVLCAWAGGGGGGGCTSAGWDISLDYYAGSGGGGGGGFMAILDFNLCSKYRLQISAGGAGGDRNNGLAGGDTILSGLPLGESNYIQIITAKGGGGGFSDNINLSGGAGGTVSGSNLNYIHDYLYIPGANGGSISRYSPYEGGQGGSVEIQSLGILGEYKTVTTKKEGGEPSPPTGKISGASGGGATCVGYGGGGNSYGSGYDGGYGAGGGGGGHDTAYRKGGDGGNGGYFIFTES